MKKFLPVVFLALAACAGCTTTYNLTLTNGEVITARGKPKYDSQNGVYFYKSVNGQTNFVFAAKVREIAPTSMADKRGSQFIN
jgi:hypothetical protein